MQDIEVDEHGVVRFAENKIVSFLLKNGGFNMNELANFSRDDRQQFAQLIGYSVSGFGDLDYASKKIVEAADLMAEELLKNESEVKP